MNNWGLKLKEIREQKKLTQEELSKSSGVGRGYIAKIETGLIKDPGRDTFSALAKGLGMTLDQLNEAITGERLTSQPETTEQVLERLRLTMPVAIPVYKDFPMHAGEPVDVQDYVYLARPRGTKKGLEAYPVRGNCLSPAIEEGDIVIVQRDAEVNEGNIVACFYKGEMHLGRLRKIAGDTFIENSHGRIRLEETPVIARVIQIERVVI